MTPRSPSGRPRAPRTPFRSIGALALAVATIGATPLVAHAWDGDSNGEPAYSAATVEFTSAPATPTRLVDAAGIAAVTEFAPAAPDDDVSTTEPSVEPEVVTVSVAEPKLERVTPAVPEPEPEPAPEPAVDPLTALLTDSYEWDERSPRVEALQEALGVSADGWYGAATARAHRDAVEFAELPADNLPEPVLPPGPSAEAWAALRDCEAGGDYTITNPSGTYRGAYQFNRSTWDSVAGRHAPDLVGTDPAAAAPADQDAMALALWHERGSAPWPHCGRHLR
ncbi:transglycosylase family protein [Ilumatobacter nonamiensis]|uniref:transglycosylase family protein n=1 Tax=Ilumatobacter nonamiensis TaxID=467093 RepID=UPI00068917E0|nr:transglycosylase family protein [Ilumatobacter nonamiensis]